MTVKKLLKRYIGRYVICDEKGEVICEGYRNAFDSVFDKISGLTLARYNILDNKLTIIAKGEHENDDKRRIPSHPF